MAQARMEYRMDVNSAGHMWFWRNYDACMQWREQHKVAYWRSKALALEYERDALLQYVLGVEGTNNVPHGQVSSGHSSPQGRRVHNNRRNSRKRSNFQRHKHQKRVRTHARCENASLNSEHDTNHAVVKEPVSLHPGNESNDDSIVDDELLEFFKQSMKHKIELKKRRKADEESDSTDSLSLGKKSASVRSEEMKMLYGNNSAMIQGMETAMQLTFERHCDLLNPVLWPILPLKL